MNVCRRVCDDDERRKRRGETKREGFFVCARKECSHPWRPSRKSVPSKIGAKSDTSRSCGHVAFRNLEKQKKPRRRFLFRGAIHSFRTHPHPPPNANTMSAFLAGSPVVAKVAAKPVAKRNVTVRAAAPSEYVPRSVPFYLTRRTSNRRDTARRRASRLTSDAPPRFLPPRAFVNSGVTRRAAVAGVLALFVAQPVRALPIIASSGEKEKNADTTSKTFRRCLSLLSLTRDESSRLL